MPACCSRRPQGKSKNSKPLQEQTLRRHANRAVHVLWPSSPREWVKGLKEGRKPIDPIQLEESVWIMDNYMASLPVDADAHTALKFKRIQACIVIIFNMRLYCKCAYMTKESVKAMVQE